MKLSIALQRFDTMSDAELVALTDEQIALYMDLACAEAGVPLMPPDPGPAPPEPERKQDVTHWVVGGFAFRNAEDAAAVANLVNGLPRLKADYARGGSYRDRISKSDDAVVTVEQERLYSPNAWDDQRAQVIERQAALEQHERLVSEWVNASEQRAKTAGFVHDRIADARVRESARERYQAEMERYKTLANGDEHVAYRFLIAAHPDAHEFVPAPAPDARPAPAEVRS